MGRAIDVEIMGQVFSVTSDDEEEHVRGVAAAVDARMREMAAGGRVASSYTVAVLTALNIASDYQKLREERRRIDEIVDRLATRVTAKFPDTKGKRGKGDERVLGTGR